MVYLGNWRTESTVKVFFSDFHSPDDPIIPVPSSTETSLSVEFYLHRSAYIFNMLFERLALLIVNVVGVHDPRCILVKIEGIISILGTSHKIIE